MAARFEPYNEPHSARTSSEDNNSEHIVLTARQLLAGEQKSIRHNTSSVPRPNTIIH